MQTSVGTAHGEFSGVQGQLESGEPFAIESHSPSTNSHGSGAGLLASKLASPTESLGAIEHVIVSDRRGDGSWCGRARRRASVVAFPALRPTHEHRAGHRRAHPDRADHAADGRGDQANVEGMYERRFSTTWSTSVKKALVRDLKIMANTLPALLLRRRGW
jgi:hypothetical protein